MQQFRQTSYKVSREGAVYRKGKTNPLKPDVSPFGYHRVTLCVDGKTERHLLHRMVAELYLPPDQSRPHVNHKDSNPRNNHVDNLEWCTVAENGIHSHRLGRASNLVASKQASVNKMLETEAKFRQLLGKDFIRIENTNPRNYVVFTCPDCHREMRCRTDSTSMTSLPISCRACKFR